VSIRETIATGEAGGNRDLGTVDVSLWPRPDAFSESKRMRTGQLCSKIREPMSARVAREVEIWNGDDPQTRLHEAAKQLAR